MTISKSWLRLPPDERRGADLLDQMEEALVRMLAAGHSSRRLLLGRREAAELAALMEVLMETWQWPEPRRAELLGERDYPARVPLLLLDIVTTYGVTVELVDQPSLLGVVGDG